MAGFNPQVFQWARESAGLSLEDAARAVKIVATSLSAIERGEKEPSRTNLVNMAKTYRRSLLTLYLAAPPKKGDRGEDFRTVGVERTVEANADVDALVRDLRARQSLVRAVLEDEEEVLPLAFINSSKIQDGTAALCRSIEQTLGITRHQFRDQRDSEQAFKLLRQKVEKVGVFVLLVAQVVRLWCNKSLSRAMAMTSRTMKSSKLGVTPS